MKSWKWKLSQIFNIHCGEPYRYPQYPRQVSKKIIIGKVEMPPLVVTGSNQGTSFQLVYWGSHEQASKDSALMNSQRKQDIQQFFNHISSSMEICKKFCEQIPDIVEVNPGDRELLYQSALLKLVVLRMAYR